MLSTQTLSPLLPKSSPRKRDVESQTTLDQLLVKVHSALTVWICQRKLLPAWQAPPGSDPEWAAHIERLQIPVHRSKPSLLLHNIGEQSWLSYDPNIEQRVKVIFAEGLDTLR